MFDGDTLQRLLDTYDIPPRELGAPRRAHKKGRRGRTKVTDADIRDVEKLSKRLKGEFQR